MTFELRLDDFLFVIREAHCLFFHVKCQVRRKDRYNLLILLGNLEFCSLFCSLFLIKSPEVLSMFYREAHRTSEMEVIAFLQT